MTLGWYLAVSVLIFMMVRLLPGNILDLFFAGDPYPMTRSAEQGMAVWDPGALL